MCIWWCYKANSFPLYLENQLNSGKWFRLHHTITWVSWSFQDILKSSSYSTVFGSHLLFCFRFFCKINTTVCKCNIVIKQVYFGNFTLHHLEKICSLKSKKKISNTLTLAKFFCQNVTEWISTDPSLNDM